MLSFKTKCITTYAIATTEASSFCPRTERSLQTVITAQRDLKETATAQRVKALLASARTEGEVGELTRLVGTCEIICRVG